ncbi:MAG: RNA-binding transcriptional accessory protein [Anaerolineae bacterium]|nr:RNA-binding transcriptional accessory protein [Anaerolineae bacterium]
MLPRYDDKIAQTLHVRPTQVSAAIELLDAGNTLPFIARYRKEVTGNLDEEQLRSLIELLERLRTLDKRRDSILASIEEQGKLTPQLQEQIASAETLTALEDLYSAYKPKRGTRASAARDKGLQGLADLILAQARTGKSLADLARDYLNDQVPDVDAALAGARDIVAEVITDHPEIRRQVRERAMRYGLMQSQKVDAADDPKKVYETYYAFELRADRLKPYQVLALNRGEADKVLRVALDVADRDWRQPIQYFFRSDSRSLLADQLEQAITDAAHRLLLPAIERSVRTTLTEQAELHAINIFAMNLRGLLTQPPLSNHVVLGLDPGFRTGSKVAVIDTTGKVLETATIYPHEPQRQRDASLRTLRAMIERHHVTLIAIGNGTASRETEQLVAELTRNAAVRYLIVNEAGASIYSASPLARTELPDLDVTLRGAVSIARRAQDPLAELIKIDPKGIGVGMYQHDINQKQLSTALDGVVETVVNRVGVDLNTASAALLTYVSGIGPKLADKIISHRDENGQFPDRQSLRKVPGLGPKAFEQAAGFLRVRNSPNPLDASAIHPESYKIAETVLKRASITAKTPASERASALTALKTQQPIATLAAELGTGEPTLNDIFEQLIRPGRDPREDVPAPLLRSDVLSMEDLQVGMQLSGTVRNLVDFGAFIDIGVKQDGLLHRSQVPHGQLLSVGDVLQVEILSIDPQRGRIGLGWSEAKPQS